ncbi:S-layer homology domain-containing protein [Ureibacillus suwonensis]|uniref:S-layer homology domain-containing protein n=1 Tax=Ureibacillus suwonensis TaxID=313007 RepID=A0ABW0RAJ4_9BACL
MANQPKNYKKFVATAATATLVASAIVPVASAASFSDIEGNTHADAIKALSDAGIIKGYEDGTFKPNAEINRGQTVKLLGRWLETKGYKVPENWNTVQRFNDLPVNAADSELVKYAALVKDAGVFNGSNGNLNYSQPMQRQQMALVLVRAIKTVEGIDLIQDYKEAGFTSSIKDLNKAFSTENVEAITALEYAGITVVENFNPTSAITRGQFASFLNRTINYEVPVKVESVSAINATTLTVTGTALNKLTAEDITVENNTVKSFTASADGKSATVVLNNQLIPDVTTKVTIKGTSFDVTYKIEATKISVVEATYDDDIANQFVAIQVDGKSVTAQELINAGYTLKFEAYKTKAATNSLTDALFKNADTGELRTDLNDVDTDGTLADILGGNLPTAGQTVYVKVTLTKGSEVITSDLTPIIIKNLDLAANSITAATLKNYGIDKENDNEWQNDFYQSSSTLVTGEKAKFVEIKVKAGSEEEKVTSGYSVKSSDVSVISVDSDGVLTAEGPGKATITISYGEVTYTKTFTVTNAARKPASIKADKTSLTLTENGTATTKIKLLDQYGDPMPITDNVKLKQSDETKAVASISETTDETGEATLTFTGTGNGKGTNTVTFYDAANAKIGTTAVTATVTDNDTLAKYSLAVDSDISSDDVDAIKTALGIDELTASDISTDATLDIQSDKYVKIDISGLNSAGVKVSDEQNDAEDYTVTVNQSKADVLAEIGDDGEYALAADGFIVLKAGTETGTATITVKNNANNNIVATFKVTVESVGYNVTGATLKDVPSPTYATTLNYEDFLSYTAADKDPVISGIKLTKASAHPVRLALTDGAGTVGDLYIDKNADGVYDATDVKVGYVTISTLGTFADEGPYDVVNGVSVASGDDGTVLFKVLDNNSAVVATKSVKVDF